MSFNFGGPASGPDRGVEEADGRYARDHEARGGDQKYTYDGAKKPVLATVAADAAGGRNDRDLLEQTVDRQEHLYVDGETGISAVTGAKGADFDELKAGPPAQVAGQ
jgi:hypothetical protein